MIFHISRLLFFLIIVILSILGIKKSTIKHKKTWAAIAFVICILVVSATSMFPIENMFVHYKTPEIAFKYMYGYRVRSTLMGIDSSMVIYDKNDSTHGFCIIPKSKEGFSLPTTLTDKTVYHSINKNGAMEVHHVNGYADYYVFAVIPVESEISELFVIDKCGRADNASKYILEQRPGFLSVYIYTNDSPIGDYLVIGETRIPIGNGESEIDKNGTGDGSLSHP